MDKYPSDYAEYTPHIKTDLENRRLPDLNKVPIQIYSGPHEILYIHQEEGLILGTYRGAAEYTEVPSKNRWHPELKELAHSVAVHASDISRINADGMLEIAPSDISPAKLNELTWWPPGKTMQFAPLPLGWVVSRGESTEPVTLAPGIWVCFMERVMKGEMDDI